MSSIIKTTDLSKTYYRGRARIDAVKEVNLSVEKGEYIAIIGPSGAGKSTLLHMLGGLDRPTAGAVLFEGKDLYRLTDGERSRLRNRHLGFVFQFYNLLSDFTVLENVMMPALIKGDPKAARRRIAEKAKALLRRMDLCHRLTHRPSELSGGEAQRVAIARALINDPEVIFCDEPTGNLDSDMGRQIFEILYSASRKNGMSVIIVTHGHDIGIAFDKVYNLKDGVIVEQGLNSKPEIRNPK